MSDVQQSPDWWIAADGKWYPPESHPDYVAPAAAAPQFPPPPGAAPQELPYAAPAPYVTAASQGQARPSAWGQPGAPLTPPKKPGFGSRIGGALKSTVVRGVVVVGVLAGIGGIASIWDADRDDSGKVTEEGNAKVDEVRVGDCFETPDELEESPESAEIGGLKLIPCDKAHDFEMYAEVILTDGDDAAFPGQQALDDQASLECLAPYEAYVGVPLADSTYVYNWFIPVEAGWKQGDRQIMCILQTTDGSRLTGSVKGTRK